jgi:hypothetical protein
VVIQEEILWAAASTEIALKTSSSWRKGGRTVLSHLSEFRKLTDGFFTKLGGLTEAGVDVLVFLAGIVDL